MYRVAEKILDLIIKHRVISLLLVFVITLLAFSQLSKLEVDNSNDGFFLENDPARVTLDQFREEFGNDDFVFILAESDDAFTQQHLSLVDALVQELEVDVPYLYDITWIGNVESVITVDGNITIEKLIPEEALKEKNSNPELKAIKQKIIVDPSYRNRLISADGRYLGILLEFARYPQASPVQKEIPLIINKIIEKHPKLNLHITGLPVILQHMDSKTAQESPVWLGVALLMIMLVLSFTMRSLRGVIIPIVTLFISIIWTMAIVALLDYKMNILALMVPTLLLCLAIGDTMHVIVDYVRAKKTGSDPTNPEVLKGVLTKINRPLFLTTLTTALGFLSFTVIELVPLREIGIQAVIGVWIAWLLTYLFAVPVLSFGKNKFMPSEKSVYKEDFFDRILALMTKVVLQSPTAVVAFFITVLLVSVYGISKLEVETNWFEDLPENDQVRMAFDHVDKNMGGSMGMEILIKTANKGDVKSIDLMRDIETIQKYLTAHPFIIETSSIVDQLKQMNRAVNDNDSEFYTLPEKKAQIAEYLVLYEIAGGEQLKQFVNFDYDVTRLQIRTQSLGTREIKQLENDIGQYLQSNFPNMNASATGTLSMFRALGDHIATGTLKSLLMAIITISIVMMVVLRSVVLGLVAMIPNIFPMIVALGALGLSGIDLNMMTMILSPIILGVAVNDSIHFFASYGNNFNQYQNFEAAYAATMKKTGRALLFTTISLIAGFVGFSFSEFESARAFSWSAGLAFASAFLADSMLVPLLLKWYHPAAKEGLGG